MASGNGFVQFAGRWRAVASSAAGRRALSGWRKRASTRGRFLACLLARRLWLDLWILQVASSAGARRHARLRPA